MTIRNARYYDFRPRVVPITEVSESISRNLNDTYLNETRVRKGEKRILVGVRLRDVACGIIGGQSYGAASVVTICYCA